MAQATGQTLFQSYETSYCTASTAISTALSSLTGLPQGALFFIIFVPVRFQHTELILVHSIHADQRRAQAKKLEKDIKDAEQIVSTLSL